MADVHSKAVRSFNMSRIRSKNTKPEILVRKFLHKNGLRYRLHVKSLQGTPDILLPKYRTIVLVNGCFWHGHTGCNSFKLPTTRADWWESKIRNNSINDSNAKLHLQGLGYKVLTIWECDLINKMQEKTLNTLLQQILENIQSA